MLHLSFLLILFGAFVTRYIGYEGMMPIREGASENQFLSEKTYLTIFVDGEMEGEPRRKKLESDLLLSEHVDNTFRQENDFNGQAFSISYIDFLDNATEGLVLDETGERYLKIVEAGDGVYIEPNLLHSAVCLEEGELIDTFSPVREDFLSGDEVSYFGDKS